MKRVMHFGLIGWLALTLASPLIAQPFTYQGFLRQGGQPVNGTTSLTFRLYDAPTGGNQLGSAITQNVNVQNGLFTVVLDFGAVWTGADRYLEIQVGSTTLSPRVKITPTPYASYAASAGFAQRPWQTSGSNIFYSDGNVGIGTSSPAARLSLGGGNANTKLAIWEGAGAADLMGLGVGPAQFRLHLHNATNRFSFLNAPNGSEVMTILGTGNVGIGTSSPAERLHVVGNIRLADDSSIFGLDRLVGFNDLRFYGDATGGPDLYITPDGSIGIGTTSPFARLSLGGGEANTKLAIWQGGTASDVMGLGVGPAQFRLHLPNATNRFSFLNAPNGTEIVTIQGNGRVGIGTTSPAERLHVVGNLRVTHNQETLTLLESSATTGAWLRLVNTSEGGRTWSLISTGSANSEGAGRLLFHDDAAGTRMTIDQNGGVGIGTPYPNARLAVVDGSLGMRVFATEATTGYTSAIEAYSYAAGTYTIYGYSGSTVGTPVTVYAHNSSPTGAAVLTVGNLVVGGAKAFRIDHPLHPATHYLDHFCTEGPDPYNAYSGIVTLDSNGEAWVQLPDYFEAANRDPRYTLTPVGAPMPNLHVAVEVQNNRFKIAGGAPNKKVSWRVEAIRDDPIIRWHGYQVEQEKPPHEMGKYLRPEAYGLPREMGISPLPPEPMPRRNLTDSENKR